MLSLPPLALYVHLPWCERKCPYCDFNSHVHGSDPPFAAYRHRLLEDLEEDLEWIQGRPVRSVFIGGGTPSLFPGQEIAALIEGIRARVELAADAEISLEANPGSAEAGKFSAFRAAGVDRLSIGVQSFDDASLHALGRIHDAHEAHTAVEAACSAGFTDFNIDLMHGLPGQSAADAARDLEQAIALGAPHVSWYQLTIERNTRFHREPPELPGEDTLGAIEASGFDLLARGGFDRYEVSAFAKQGHRCTHNLNYWQFGDYLGIGAGAHGKLTVPERGVVLRTRRTRAPADYLGGEPGQRRAADEVPSEQLPLEYLMNALRLPGGTPLEAFAQRTGVPPEILADMLQPLRDEGLLVAEPGCVRVSELGFRYLDAVLTRLL